MKEIVRIEKLGLVLPNWVEKSDSIYPVDRLEENDLNLVAAIPKTVEAIGKAAPGLREEEVVDLAVAALFRALHGRENRDHQDDLVEEYYHQLNGAVG